MHFVLRSTKAKGKLSFLSAAHHGKTLNIIKRQSARFGVKIYQIAINGNHIHLLVRIGSRFTWKKWLRALSGLIARRVLGAERGKAQGKGFWNNRLWSRTVVWGRAFRLVKA